MVHTDPTCSLWLDKNVGSRRGSDFSRLDFDTSSMFDSNVQLSSSLDVIDWSKTKIPKRTSINRYQQTKSIYYDIIFSSNQEYSKLKPLVPKIYGQEGI